jgi:hypothetical protein
VLPVDQSTSAPHTAHREMVTELDWYRGIGTPIAAPHAGRHAATAAEVRTRRQTKPAQHGYTAGEIAAPTRRRAADQTPHVARSQRNPEAATRQRPRCRTRDAEAVWQTMVSWRFDVTWYLATYPDAHCELGDTDDAAVFRFYLEQGQARGHSPNIWSTKPGI